MIFGVWLNRAGKPYPVALFNIHKLVALGVFFLGGVQLSGSASISVMSAGVLAILTLSGLCILALLVSGAMLSAGKLDARQMRTTHTAAATLLTGVLIISVLAARWHRLQL
jgi:hypothetical protein